MGWLEAYRLPQGTRDCDPRIAYLHEPFVVEGDADGEDVVKENKSDDPKSPAYELHQVSHRGGEFLLRMDHLQPCPVPLGEEQEPSHPHATPVDPVPFNPTAALARATV